MILYKDQIGNIHILYKDRIGNLNIVYSICSIEPIILRYRTDIGVIYIEYYINGKLIHFVKAYYICG